MDWYPLWNSLRIALVSCAAVFFLGIFAADVYKRQGRCSATTSHRSFPALSLIHI